MKINDNQKGILLNIIKELELKLQIIIGSLDELYKLLDECEIDSYYRASIQELISESKIRADMANIRTDEFKDEIENSEISMDGFY